MLSFFIFQLLQYKLVAHQMMSALWVKHVEIGLVSTHVCRKILAVLVQDVLFQTTRQPVPALQVQRVILTPDVFPVSSIKSMTFVDYFSMENCCNWFHFFPVKKGECTHDSECPDDKACTQYQCRNPCHDANPCGKSAECEAKGHRAVCKCPAGWGGHPSTECFKCRFSSNPFVF